MPVRTPSRSRLPSPASVARAQPAGLYSILAPRQKAELDFELAEHARGLGLPQGSLKTIAASLSPQSRPTIVTDGPATEDRMGFHPVVRALADIVLSSATETPLAIGVDGPWGSGKSSILRMVEDQARLLGFNCISLNAWSLERTEQLVASVTSGIQEEIRKAGPTTSGSLGERIATFAARAVASLVPNAIGGDAVRGQLEADITKSRIAGDIREVASIASTQSSFEDLVNLLLDNNPAAISLPPGRRRLLILIDDVDRALPDQIATILRNLKLVLEVPRCIFLLAMDMDLVAQSIENFYGSRNTVGAISVLASESSRVDVQPQLGGIPLNFGKNYLEKLVQIRIPVPQLSREVAIDYVYGLGMAEEIVEIVSWAPNHEILNPRRLKRYLNTLSVMLQLIMACSLPRGVDNAFALRALALRRDYPADYARLTEARDPIGMRPDWSLDDATAINFQEYLEKLLFPLSALPAFEAFLREKPFFSP